MKRVSVLLVLVLGLTLGATASAWSTADSEYKAFEQGSSQQNAVAADTRQAAGTTSTGGRHRRAR